MKLSRLAPTPLLLVALGLAASVQPALTQDSRTYYHPLTLAPADTSSSGSGAGTEA